MPTVNVLLVEELPASLATCREALIAQGLGEVSMMAPGELVSGEPALVVVDLSDARGDGWEVARRLRSSARASRTAILAVTGPAPGASLLTALYAPGGVDHVTRPIVPEVLAAKAKLLIEWARPGPGASAGRAAALDGVPWPPVSSRRWQHMPPGHDPLLRQVTDVAPAILWVSDPRGDCVFISRGWAEFTGQGGEATLGTGWHEAIHPEDRERIAELARQAHVNREAYTTDYRVRRPDGSVRWALDAARPRFDANGEYLGHVGSVIDITERKAIERQLREQERRKDEFLATLAHELRNPLAPLRTGLELLEQLPADDGAVVTTRAIMARQLGHLVHLVDDLLDVSRMEHGQLTLRPERVTLQTVVEHALEASRPVLASAGHTLIVRVPPAPIELEADLTRLVQVVSNLLHNAAKYTPHGGRVEVTAQVEGGAAVVRVTDDGIGMDDDVLPTIFDLFTQGHRTLQRAQGGLGLGLSLSRQLMAMHHGTLDATSPGPGKGSTFTVRLPVAEPAVDATRGPSVRPPPARRILVVDDNEDGAEMLAALLARRGHETRTAFDGEQALRIAPGFAPDIVFLDIGLPDIDGHEVARRLRADPVTGGATLVALTGWGGEADKQRTREAGFDAHLTKPVDAATVDEVLRQSTAPR